MIKKDDIKENLAPVNTGRRDFTKLVGLSCGIGCICYAGAQAINYMAPSEDAKADSTTEVNISALASGQTMKIMWRGKPVFIKNRTKEEVDLAKSVDFSKLLDPEDDSKRVKKNKENILVVLGVCTHLGCVPITHSGDDYNGWFCPCHGSQYDCSGRVIRGPAPTNLTVPPYKFVNDNTLIIGVEEI